VAARPETDEQPSLIPQRTSDGRPQARFVFALAAGAVLGCTYLWAWMDKDFWKPLPLYPCVAAAGLLAALALYAHSKRLLRAALLAAVISMVSLTGAAMITLGRWEI
jgi:peptidoglycan/LPS O-acetylase OafA/YrhL